MGELGLLLLNESSWGASDAWGGGGARPWMVYLQLHTPTMQLVLIDVVAELRLRLVKPVGGAKERAELNECGKTEEPPGGGARGPGSRAGRGGAARAGGRALRRRRAAGETRKCHTMTGSRNTFCLLAMRLW